MDLFDYFRLFNILIAGLALLLNVGKAIRFKFHKIMDPDSAMGFLALMSWCLAYSLAASIATLNDVQTGIWTIIMGVPCWWTFTAGCWGWSPTPDRK